MRRLVLVLLIALLPLQAIWAAAANACGHEHTAGKAHFGHHEHAAATITSAVDDGHLADADGACGGDCSTCHGHGWSVAVLDTPPPLAQSDPGFVRSAYQRSVPQRHPDNPLRPPLASPV